MRTILSRIQEIASNEGITIGAMERSLGASKGVLSRAIANGTDIQSKWIQTLVENYPIYSPEWLLTGKGSMLKSDEQPLPEAKKTSSRHKGIPLIPMEAIAGFPAIDNDGVSFDDCQHYSIPEFEKNDDCILCVSENKRYKPFSLPKDDIRSLSTIVGLVRLV